jgi:hypothetical protein
MSASGDDRISEETRMMAAEVRRHAESMPSAADIGDLAAAALTGPPGEITPQEIRQLARDALSQAQRLSFLLGRLAGMLDGPEGP